MQSIRSKNRKKEEREISVLTRLGAVLNNKSDTLSSIDDAVSTVSLNFSLSKTPCCRLPLLLVPFLAHLKTL